MLTPVTSAQSMTAPTAVEPRKLRELSKDLEATFIAEMLKQANFGKTPESFGGGAGEDQFASFLRQSQADEMAKSGGIGLAENLFQALSKAVEGRR